MIYLFERSRLTQDIYSKPTGISRSDMNLPLQSQSCLTSATPLSHKDSDSSSGKVIIGWEKMCPEFHHVILAVQTCYGSPRNSWGPPLFSPRCPYICHGDEGRAVPESALY